MMFNDDAYAQNCENPTGPPGKGTPSTKLSIFTPDNIIAIYTVLSILRRMKARLGLEAMLDYLEQYCFVIEKDNPQFKLVVKKALTLMDVRKIYGEMLSREE